MKEIALILDPAHGKDVKGKSSPDKKHLEYLWSRETLAEIFDRFGHSANKNIYSPFLTWENEPGLTHRVETYNDIALSHDETIVFSLHNDAQNPKTCNKNGFGSAHGIAFWTSRGETLADKVASYLYNQLEMRLPDEHFRKATWLGKGEKVSDPDYEANFTILAGNQKVKPKYIGILCEFKFMTNEQDLSDLLNPQKQIVYQNALFRSLLALINKIEIS